MWPYWLMFGSAALPALRLYRHPQVRDRTLWVLVAAFLALAIGLRYEVGGDWLSYLWHYERVASQKLLVAIQHGDPGYVFINWVAGQFDLGIYGVNLFCGAVFLFGLSRFCRLQPNPWLALTVAIPYILIVISMGYSRQGVALGFVFLALAHLELDRYRRFIFWIAIASLFHQSAVLLIPLAIFVHQRGIFARLAACVLVGYGLWVTLLADEQDRLWYVYVELQMHSTGAVIRVLMNLLPALLLIANWKRWKGSFNNPQMWLWMSFAAVACAVSVQFATTAVDRVALYLTPLQIVVFSRLPDLIGGKARGAAINTSVVVFYALVQFVWLNFGRLAYQWLPYKSAVFEF